MGIQEVKLEDNKHIYSAIGLNPKTLHVFSLSEAMLKPKAQKHCTRVVENDCKIKPQ